MAKVQKIETTHYIYEYELSEEELKQFNEDEEAFWDQFEEDNWGDYYMDVDSTQPEYNFLED